MLLLCLSPSPAPVSTSKRSLLLFIFLIVCLQTNKCGRSFLIVLIDCVHFLCIVIDQNCSILFVCSQCLFNPASKTKLLLLCCAKKKIKTRLNTQGRQLRPAACLDLVFCLRLPPPSISPSPRTPPPSPASPWFAPLQPPVSLYDSPRPPPLTVTGNFASLPFVAVTKGAGALSQAMLHAVA